MSIVSHDVPDRAAPTILEQCFFFSGTCTQSCLRSPDFCSARAVGAAVARLAGELGIAGGVLAGRGSQRSVALPYFSRSCRRRICPARCRGHYLAACDARDHGANRLLSFRASALPFGSARNDLLDPQSFSARLHRRCALPVHAVMLTLRGRAAAGRKPADRSIGRLLLAVASRAAASRSGLSILWDFQAVVGRSAMA